MRLGCGLLSANWDRRRPTGPEYRGLSTRGREKQERIFPSPKGGQICRTNWRRRIWLPAVAASVGVPLRYHDLRHSHAAILIAQGEHERVIADRLGHANPMVTMTTYAHLFDGLDVAAAERLDEAWAQSVTDPGRTQAIPTPISMNLDSRNPPISRGVLWWALRDLNPRPLPRQGSALPLS